MSRHIQTNQFRAFAGPFGLVLLAFGMMPIAGCDPCSGIVGCEGEPRLSVEGDFIVYATGEPAPGVSIELIQTSGARLRDEMTAAVTDENGHFQLDAPALEEGNVIADITVRPPHRPPYTIEGASFPATTRLGDGTVLPSRWVVDPYVEYLGELVSRYTGRTVGFGAHVVFRPTGGVEIAEDSIHAVTDHFGRFFLNPTPLGQGEVVGTLTIAGVVGSSYRVSTIPGVRIQTNYRENALGIGGVFYLGPSLSYVGELQYSEGGGPVVGAEVEFQRTGGIEASPEFLVSQSNESGRFALIFRTEQDGLLVGDLIIRPPGGAPEKVFRDVEIPTFEANELRLLRIWEIRRSS